MISLKLNLQIVRSLQMSPDYTGSPFYPKEPPMYANVCNPWQQEFHFDWCVDYNLEGAFVIWYFFAQAEWSLDHPSPVCPPAKEHIQVPCCQDSLVHYKGQDNREFLVGGGFVAATSGSSCFLHVTQCNKFDIKALCHAKRWYKLLQNAANIWMFCSPVGDCEIAKMALWDLRKVSRLAVLHPRPSASHRFMKFCPSNLCCHMLSPHWFVEFQAQGQMGGEAVEMEETPECRVDGMRENQLAWQKYLSTGRDIETWWNMMKHVWMCLCNIYRFRHIRGHAGIVWYTTQCNTSESFTLASYWDTKWSFRNSMFYENILVISYQCSYKARSCKWLWVLPSLENPWLEMR